MTSILFPSIALSPPLCHGRVFGCLEKPSIAMTWPKRQDVMDKNIELKPCLPPSRTNYKDYSMESRTQFRVHAALAKLKVSPAEQEDMTRL